MTYFVMSYYVELRRVKGVVQLRWRISPITSDRSISSSKFTILTSRKDVEEEGKEEEEEEDAEDEEEEEEKDEADSS